MPTRRPLTLLATGLVALASLGSTASVAKAPAYKDLRPANLQVTEGAIAPAGEVVMRTRSAAMRAVARDGGRQATKARLRFRLLGPSDEVEPLGSGLVRQQIGLKLRAADPCNLLYVMWHATPEQSIQVQIKRNPGQTTSAQCGNRGYTELTSIPMPPADRALHTLDAQTRRTAGGALILAVYADGDMVQRLTIPAALAAGLEGPIGVRSDNGHYLFRLAARR
jgi:hypothetical protein